DGPDLDAGVDEIPQRRILPLPLAWKPRLPGVSFLIDVRIRMRCEDEAHADDSLDIPRRKDVDVHHDPPPSFERYFPIDFVQEIYDARRVRVENRADVVSGALDQNLLQALGRQSGIVVEAGPSGVGRSRGAHVVARLPPDIGVDAGQLEPVVAGRRLTEPSAPALDQRSELRISGGLPIRAEDQARTHCQRAV